MEFRAMRRRRQQLSEAESIHILEKATPVAHWLFWGMAAIPTPFPSVMSMPMESCDRARSLPYADDTFRH